MPNDSPETAPLLGTTIGNVENSRDSFAHDPLLDSTSASKDDFCENGITSDDDDDDDDEAELKKQRAQRIKESGGWIGYLGDFKTFLPYLIPRRDAKVQLAIVICLISLAGCRLLTVAVPYQLGIVADKLVGGEVPLKDLALWFVLRILDSTSGLEMVEEFSKIPIKQFAERSITNAAFKHIMSLSMDFHSERDSAEVMKALDQGSSLTSLLETAICESLPTVIDMTVAIGIFYWRFDAYVSGVMVIACASFFATEVITSRWKVGPRREYAKTQRQEARVMHQAIQGWTTVSYFNMVPFERKRFGICVDAKLVADRKWAMREAFFRGLTELFLPTTFFIIAIMIMHDISKGTSTPGDFVFFIQYWDNLQWPLQWLSHDYRQIMSNLIDAERLLVLLKQKPSIIDVEGAHDIRSSDGLVAFENVSFAYNNRRTTIANLNFSVRPGKTLALVGSTGAGKSTVAKLLLRFYDVTGGSIAIDGHDIRDITLDSLRENIGVVPQDPLLFNGTILENLRYAKRSATFDEIVKSCQAAAIHDKIMTFAEGYRTRVGEQGVKLSGGEIQRLAVARVILKDPPILILDEATSAIDTHTETNIQRALDAFKKKSQRTTLIIAHRLSTIVGADQILVFDEGQAVERGTHEELLGRKGVYKKLWDKQIGVHD